MVYVGKSLSGGNNFHSWVTDLATESEQLGFFGFQTVSLGDGGKLQRAGSFDSILQNYLLVYIGSKVEQKLSVTEYFNVFETKFQLRS